MAMLQHYYTSTTRGTSGSAGFQCKAMSPGISAEELNILNKLIGYRIPPTLMDRPISEHPAALRYDYWGTQKCVLLCSQSNGSDENGRPGNFFAHSVITSPKDFEVIPPIMFYRHPFWRTCDDSPRLEIPPEPEFTLAPSMDFQQIWPFLEVGERRGWFSGLLSAVVGYEQSKRPVVILDSMDNIALWILAVTVALPQIYRTYLTFSTYHHDPYQAPFLITGTTSDSKFRFSSDEYISYFIINAENNRASEIETSDFVQFISQNFWPEAYENKLLDFFQLCNHRLPPSKTAINAKLDSLTHFYLAVRERRTPLSDIRAQDGLHSFIENAKSKNNLLEEDLEDLATTAELLGSQVMESPTLTIVQDYGNALRLLKRHHPNYSSQARNDMQFLANLVQKNREDIVQSLMAIYMEIYQQEVLSQVISKPNYLDFLEANALSGNWQVQYLIWKYLMPLARIDTTTKDSLTALLRKALLSAADLSCMDPDIPPPEAEQLLDAVLAATINNQRFLLEVGLEELDERSGMAYSWLYYKLVGDLSLAKRLPYRKLVAQVFPKMLAYEVRRDVKRTDSQGLLPVVEGWVGHLESDPAQQVLVLSQTMETALLMAAGDQRYRLAESFLTNPNIVRCLNDDGIAKVLTAYFSTQSFEVLGTAQVKLYNEYYNHAALTLVQQAVIGGSFAMSTGRFIEKSVPKIQQLLSRLNATSYQAEAGKLIVKFFRRGVQIDRHMEMLHSTYVLQHGEIFWKMYWQHFIELMLDHGRTQEFVTLLAFWFDESIQVFAEIPYLAQTFFLELPGVLLESSKDKEYERAANQIRLLASKHPWYSLVDPYITNKSKHGLMNIFRR